MIDLPSGWYDDVIIMLWWLYGDVIMTSWWLHDAVWWWYDDGWMMVYCWYDDGMMIDDGRMMVWWWYNVGMMVVWWCYDDWPSTLDRLLNIWWFYGPKGLPVRRSVQMSWLDRGAWRDPQTEMPKHQRLHNIYKTRSQHQNTLKIIFLTHFCHICLIYICLFIVKYLPTQQERRWANLRWRRLTQSFPLFLLVNNSHLGREHLCMNDPLLDPSPLFLWPGPQRGIKSHNLLFCLLCWKDQMQETHHQVSPCLSVASLHRWHWQASLRLFRRSV